MESATINNLFWFEFGWVYEYIEIKYNKENNIIIREKESKEQRNKYINISNARKYHGRNLYLEN